MIISHSGFDKSQARAMNSPIYSAKGPGIRTARDVIVSTLDMLTSASSSIFPAFPGSFVVWIWFLVSNSGSSSKRVPWNIRPVDVSRWQYFGNLGYMRSVAWGCDMI